MKNQTTKIEADKKQSRFSSLATKRARQASGTPTELINDNSGNTGIMCLLLSDGILEIQRRSAETKVNFYGQHQLLLPKDGSKLLEDALEEARLLSDPNYDGKAAMTGYYLPKNAEVLS